LSNRALRRPILHRRLALKFSKETRMLDPVLRRAVLGSLEVPASAFAAGDVQKRRDVLAKIYLEHERLVALLVDLERDQLPAAREADLEAAAEQAIAAKPGKPAKAQAAGVEAQIAATRAELAVAERAVAKAWQAFSEALVDSRDRLIEKAHTRRTEAAKSLQEAFDGAAAQLQAVSEADEAERFLNAFPHKPRWRPRSPIVPDLIARSGEPYSAVDVLAAIVAVAEPPRAAEPVGERTLDTAKLEQDFAGEPEIELGSHTPGAANLIR
jgi:hypothetical protein